MRFTSRQTLTALKLLGVSALIIYLYVKRHAITELQYFGKTIKSDPFKYSGSGTYWINHCNKHGKEHIQTIEIYGFDDIKVCEEFALKYSALNNIVESSAWANLKEENGLDGGGAISIESKLKMSNYAKNRSITHKQNLNAGHIGHIGKKRSSKTKQKLRESHLGQKAWNKGIPHSPEMKQKLKDAWVKRKLKLGK